MNKLFVINASSIQMNDVDSLGEDPRFRKATKCMRMAWLAAQRVVEPYKNRVNNLCDQIGLFLGTGHGELEATRDFLRRFKKMGHGSPICFQNSLHNSTVGFLTQQLSIQGASLTTSHSYFSGEKAMELASLFLEQRQIAFALVIGVDALVPGLEEALNRMYPEDLTIGEGAGAVMLCNRFGLDLLKEIDPWCCFEGIEYSDQPTLLSKESLADFNGYYDSNFVSLFAQELLKSKRNPNLIFNKPNGAHSKVRIGIP